MIESIVISGNWIYFVLAIAILYGITHLDNIFRPNRVSKKILAGKYKPNDNTTRFAGTVGVIIAVYVISSILGWIS